MHDLVVEGGTIVTATESYRGDVGIIDGKIATLGKNLKGKKKIDATNNLVFTGRYLSDDVMGFTLTLMFGGADGTRFDGNNGTPQLTTDAVGPGDRDFTLPFPYLEVPLTQE